MHDIAPLTDDDLAILLVASHLGLARGSGAEPLGPATWHDLAARLHEDKLRPSWLLGRTADELEAVQTVDVSAGRLAILLERAGTIAFDLERLEQRGIWVVTRAGEGYPTRLRRLGSIRPPVLFGSGPRNLLDAHSIAVVGSRDVDEAGSAFADRVGQSAAAAGYVVVSGGARGVDRVAMNGALERGGRAVGVLAESLEKWLRDATLRQAIADGNLVLLTPFKPDAGFTPANAMARNKVIYGLADAAVVVASDARKGGTLSGARETLRRGWTPLLVRDGEEVPEGNRVLIGEGGVPLRVEQVADGDGLAAALAAAIEAFREPLASAEELPPPAQQPLPLGGDPAQPPPSKRKPRSRKASADPSDA